MAACVDVPVTFNNPPSVVPPPTVSGPPAIFNDPAIVVLESVDGIPPFVTSPNNSL